MDLRIAAPQGIDPALPSAVLYFYSPLSTDRALGAVVIGLKCQYLQSFIGDLADDARQIAILASTDGRVISHPDDAMILKDCSTEPFMAGVLAAKDGLSSLDVDADGVRMLVTYHKSARDWIYISMIPYSVMLAKVTAWRNITILIAGIAFTLAIVYALFGARHTFLPIRKMMDSSGFPVAPGQRADADLDFLNEQIAAYRKGQQQTKSLREDALRAWVRGELTWEELPPDTEPNDTQAGAPHRLALFRIDQTDEFRALDHGAQRTLLDALGDYALEAIRPLGVKTRVIALPPSTLAIAISEPPAISPASAARKPARIPAQPSAPSAPSAPSSPPSGAPVSTRGETTHGDPPPTGSGAFAQSLEHSLIDALAQFSRHFSQVGCAALPGPVTSSKELPNAYRAGCALLAGRFYAPNDAPAAYMEPIPACEPPRYDARLENALWHAIEKHDEAALDSALDRFLALAGQASPETARAFARQMLDALIARRPSPATGSEASQQRQAIDRVASQDTLFRMRASARALMVRWMGSQGVASARDDSIGAIERGCEMTRSNFANPAFSLNEVADELHLSPPYFNRLFRQATGESFSAYLTGYRLHKVCELLRTTVQPLAQICRQVGLSNESYCYTLFKKEYGMTPNQYRARYHVESADDTFVE